jgi:hypothetical protein
MPLCLWFCCYDTLQEKGWEKALVAGGYSAIAVMMEIYWLWGKLKRTKPDRQSRFFCLNENFCVVYDNGKESDFGWEDMTDAQQHPHLDYMIHEILIINSNTIRHEPHLSLVYTYPYDIINSAHPDLKWLSLPTSSVELWSSGFSPEQSSQTVMNGLRQGIVAAKIS